jgi:DNA-binding NtrC family response regulator
LANVIERAVVLGEGQTLSSNDFPQNLLPSQPPSLPPSLPPSSPKRDGTLSQEIARLERQRIADALEKAKGNKSETARVLGIKRSTLISKLQKYNMLL